MLYLVASRCSDSGPELLAGALADLGLVAFAAFDNVLIVKSDETAAKLRDLIGGRLPNGGALLVALLAGHASWQGYDQRSADWLLAHL